MSPLYNLIFFPKIIDKLPTFRRGIRNFMHPCNILLKIKTAFYSKFSDVDPYHLDARIGLVKKIEKISIFSPSHPNYNAPKTD